MTFLHRPFTDGVEKPRFVKCERRFVKLGESEEKRQHFLRGSWQISKPNQFVEDYFYHPAVQR